MKEDNQLFSFLLFDLLEYQGGKNLDQLRWDVVGWAGGDYYRLWFKTEGQADTDKGTAEFQLLYGRLIAPFWDLQAGIRHDRINGSGTVDARTFVIIGVQGLAPYWFDIEPWIAVSEDGDVSARVTVEYDLLLTQRLIVQPRLEIDAAIQKVQRFGIGSGINDIEAGLRLRYEIRRDFAPYVGVNRKRLVGQTAEIARRDGDELEKLSVVAGVRLWF
ncbi:MAG: copper resistance protein B [Verrucomicrobia bacterium]|nr:copper resistance protein B [Deltaproteobacteria bacterium]